MHTVHTDMTCFTYDSLVSQSDGAVHQKDGFRNTDCVVRQTCLWEIGFEASSRSALWYFLVLFCTLVRLIFIPLKRLYQSTEWYKLTLDYWKLYCCQFHGVLICIIWIVSRSAETSPKTRCIQHNTCPSLQEKMQNTLHVSFCYSWN